MHQIVEIIQTFMKDRNVLNAPVLSCFVPYFWGGFEVFS